MTWWRGAMPRYSNSSSAPSLPHTQAVAHEVVGRRTPTEESSTPARALNVDDLPEPVAPARATTVWSAVRPSLVATRVAAASASSTTCSSTRPRAARVACSRPSIRTPRSEPRDVSLLAPSSDDDIVSLWTPLPTDAYEPSGSAYRRVRCRHSAGRRRHARRCGPGPPTPGRCRG